MVTQLVVELNLLETGRNTLSRSLKREKVRAHAEDYSKHEAPVGEVIRLGVELNLLETERNTLSHSLIRVRGHNTKRYICELEYKNSRTVPKLRHY